VQSAPQKIKYCEQEWKALYLHNHVGSNFWAHLCNTMVSSEGLPVGRLLMKNSIPVQNVIATLMENQT
jgi:hypothetical protein